jgi:hypothetical protein
VNAQKNSYWSVDYLMSTHELPLCDMQWRTEGWLVQTPPPNFWRFDKAEPNSQFCGKYVHNNPTRIRVSLILAELLNLGCQHPKIFGKKAVKF